MSLVRLLTAGKSLVGLKDGQVRYRMTDPRALPKFGSSKNPFQSKAATQTLPANAGMSRAQVQSGTQEPTIEVGPGGGCEVSSVTRANRGLVVEAAGSSRSVPMDLPLNEAGLCEPRRVSEVCGLDNSGSLRKSDAPRLTEPKAGPKAPGIEDENKDETCSGPKESSAVEVGEGVSHRPTATPAAPPPPSGGTGAGSGANANASRQLKQWVSGLKALFGAGQLRPGRKPGPARGVAQPVQGELRLDNVKVLRNDLSDTDLEIVAKPPRAESRPAPPKTSTENSVPSETAWERVSTLFGAER